MKKIFLILLILLNLNLSITNADSNVSVSSSSIKNINLIESYIYNLQGQVKLFETKYNINNKEINKEKKELSNLILALNNLKHKHYSNNEYNKIINIILSQLKKNKNIIKELLKEEKKSYEINYNNKKNLYQKIGYKLNIELNTIIKKYYNIYEKKETLTKEDNQIIKVLKNLSDESFKLKNFKNIKFKSLKKMDYSFVRILKNIRREIINLKKLR